VAPTNLATTNLATTFLTTTFLTGITGVNRPANQAPSEMLRLNTAVPTVPFASQNRLGVAGNALNTNPKPEFQHEQCQNALERINKHRLE
jgi:Domain of unknown function (DUF4331)